MHLRIRNDIRFGFPAPARNLTVLLRLSPRSHEGQHVTGVRIDADIDCSLRVGQDAFGNVTHSFSAAGPIDGFTVTAVCQVETYDAAGIVRGGAERLPIDIFLRDTELTGLDAGLRQFAERATVTEAEPLGKLHALMHAVHGEIAYEETPPEPGAPVVAPTAAQAFAAKVGDASSHAHIFTAAARHLGLPCRHVTGYLLRDGNPAVSASHAWAEAYVKSLGWIGFDSVEKLCPNGHHVRVATGLDALGAAFFRGIGTDGTSAHATIAAG
ncbi:transglutaminase family protein [Lichenibacterium minor]|jgi:transglutaminase-like putative cysteine protease|uniref:Transglutaminase family protein n=1 Tax=Lichenibacterium minor TaxID=2316528 RepID=A0A4Q2U821_9HYPH|nr:transglutaminase family protein [Lichenibacterium minor]RYC32562.1 transglutaminase family protein [Lichenibacterium minor]